jgi:hypothetical protein
MLMLDSIVSFYHEIIAALVNGDRFIISILIGAGAIALHAKSRLKITAPNAQEYDFIKLVSLPDLVGRKRYRKLAILYTLSLELVYAVLCLLQPLFPQQIGAVPTDQLATSGYGGASWPLVAALGVVGVLPSVPGFGKLEEGIRNFALSLNDIPGEFFRRVARLSQGEIKEFLERDQRYRPDLARYWRIHNLALAAGCAPAVAHQAARRVVGLYLFSRWVLDSSSIWSEEHYVPLQDVLDIFRPGEREMRAQIDELLAETSKSRVVNHVMQNTAINVIRALTTDEAQAVSDYALKLSLPGGLPADAALTQPELDEYPALTDKWKNRSEDVSVMNKRLCGLFSVLALRDERVSSEYISNKSADGDPVLGEMFKLMDRSKNDLVSRLFNSWFTATVSGFLSCLVILVLIRMMFEPASGTGKLTPFQRDLFTAATFGLAAWFSGRWGLSIRNFNIERGSWIQFDQLHRFRPSQYAGIFLSAYGVGFLLMLCSTFAFTLMNGDGEHLAGVPIWSFFIYPLAWALIPATVAVALCCLADWVSQKGKPANIYVTSFALSFGVAFVAFLSGAMTGSSNDFIRLLSSDATVSALVFTAVGFLLFSASLQGYKQDELVA